MYITEALTYITVRVEGSPKHLRHCPSENWFCIKLWLFIVMFLCYFRVYSYRTEITVQCSIGLYPNTLFKGTVNLKGDKKILT